MSAAPGRPLPLITQENEFFWTSGADGRLRLQECQSCARADPSTGAGVPVLPLARHRRAGRLRQATLAGFTVNHRFSLPGLPAPYVVAQVAIAEDPRVRLTTNIVECDPDELELGQQVEVVFEQVEDVWLPLFRPAPDAEPAGLPDDEIAPERFGEHVRPMLTTEKFEDKVALTGIGMSPIGRRLMRPPLSLTVQACQAAIADAGLTVDDIDGLSTYPGRDRTSAASAKAASPRSRPRWGSGRRGTTAAWRRSAPAAR